MDDQQLATSASRKMSDEDKLDLLISLYNDLFYPTENTKLVLGDTEPLYLPASSSCDFNQVIFAHGYFSSALHEISHWLVAGKERRLLEDYGYWYKPDGRTAKEQLIFETVEIKPQAIEWILSAACAHTFHFSADNLASGNSISENFQRLVSVQAQQYITGVLPARFSLLLDKLIESFNVKRLGEADFKVS